MYKICRIVIEMAGKLRRYITSNEFSIEDDMILFELKIGRDENGRDSVRISFACTDQGYKMIHDGHTDSNKWMQTCCFAEELYKALQYKKIDMYAVCTLNCFFKASRMFIYPHPLVPRPYHTKGIQFLEQFTEQNAKSLREGVLVGVKVKSTIPGRYSWYVAGEGGYKIKITIIDK